MFRVAVFHTSKTVKIWKKRGTMNQDAGRLFFHKKGGFTMAKKKNADAWAEAKKHCKLNSADIQMAKELGMSPKSLIKNIPSKSQKWKAPVKVWISELYEEKFGRIIEGETARIDSSEKSVNRKKIDASINDEELPF